MDIDSNSINSNKNAQNNSKNVINHENENPSINVDVFSSTK